MTLADDYFEYTRKFISSHGPKTIVLMQVGSFFECYAILSSDGSYKGSLIKEFATINDMSIAPKNMCVGNENIVMAGFGLQQLDKYVKKLLEHGYTVPVFIQDINGKNTTRSLACIYSPGTYFNTNESYDYSNTNNINYNDGLSNNTITIWLHLTKANAIFKESQLTIGLSMIDILTGKLINYQYNQPYIDSPSVYDELEKYIAIYNPSEIIIITNNCNDYDGNFIDIVINYTNIYADKIHKIYLKKGEPIDKSKKYVITNEFENIAYNCEKQTYQETLIDNIYGIGSFNEKYEFREFIFANQSLCFLLDFIQKHNPSLIKSLDFPCFENHSNKLIMANHSLKQLNIISDQRYCGKLSCVANLLNNCITSSGRRQLNYMLLHPTCDIEKLNQSYNIINHLLDTQFYKNIRTYLNDVRDIEKIERKLVMKNINPKDFSILYNNLSKIKDLFLEIINNKSNLLLKNYIASHINQNILQSCNTIMEFINNTFIISKASLINIDKISSYSIDQLNFIQKSYNKELNILFKNSIDSREQLNALISFLSGLVADYEKPKNGVTKTVKKNGKKDLLEENSEENTYEYVKLHETSKNDPILLITKRRAAILKEILKKMIQTTGSQYEIKYKSSYSGTEDILNLDLAAIEFKIHGNNQSTMVLYSGHINEITHSIQNSKDILINGITNHFNNILHEFINLNNFVEENKKFTHLSILSKFVGIIDVCHCNAYNADKYNYNCPIIENKNNKSYVNFEKMRHCLIEHLNNKELYVTNDLSIGDNKNGFLLYGTNAVGKTSFIKSIGISIIMAQAGMFVPCSKFVFFPYSYLFTRLLGNDNIFKGLSTFAVEMCELRTILKNATSNSIILGDELCSGTESSSALSIFMASLQKLHSIESTFLFATHFHEILEYDELKKLNKLETYHMSVIFDREKNKLIYDRKLKLGAGEAMYGLEVCKSLDLPNDFIEEAYNIRNKYCKTGKTLLSQNKSKYNSKKLKGMCEICKLEKGSEVHHLMHQKNSNNKGIINNEFNKNHKANLINICEKCHLKIHETEIEYRIAKGTTGYELLEI